MAQSARTHRDRFTRCMLDHSFAPVCARTRIFRVCKKSTAVKSRFQGHYIYVVSPSSFGKHTGVDHFFFFFVLLLICHCQSVHNRCAHGRLKREEKQEIFIRIRIRIPIIHTGASARKKERPCTANRTFPSHVFAQHSRACAVCARAAH